MHARRARLLILLLLAVFAMAVVACQPADPTDSDSAEGEDEGADDTADEGAEDDQAAEGDGDSGDSGDDVEAEEVVVAHFGGSFEENMQEAIISSFEEEHGITVRSELGISTETLAKLRAGNSDIDVAYMDWPVAVQAKAEGLLSELDEGDIPNMADVYDSGVDPDNQMVSQYFSAVGLAYHTELVDSPPTSWSDLASDDYAGQVALADISGTSGYYSLLGAAVAEGGDEQNIDPGFEVMSEAAANALTFYDQPDQLQSLFERDEVAVAPFYQDRTAVFVEQGLPVEFVLPDEGGVLIRGSASIPQDSPNPEAAALFIDHILDPEVQAQFTELQTLGPTNRNTELSDEVAETVPYGEEVEGMIVPDDEAISEMIGDWTDRWNREVAG